VRDVTYNEDRLHGRMIGHGVSSIRNGTITLLRYLDYRRLPDAQRAIAERPALAFALSGVKDENFKNPYTYADIS